MVEKILEERDKNYGSYGNFAKILQPLKEACRANAKWVQLSFKEKESFDMVLHKVVRIINGDFKFEDSWVDIIGYSKLCVDDVSNKIESSSIRVPVLEGCSKLPFKYQVAVERIIYEIFLIVNNPGYVESWENIIEVAEEILDGNK